MKIGVLGLGSIGARHYGNLNAMGHEVFGYDPLVSCDVPRAKDLFEWCDAMVIATPSLNHLADLRAAVERGKHAFVEKPIATEIGDLPDLLAVARQKNLVIFTGYNLRFHGSVIQVKQWLDEGAIGKPLWASFICAQYNTKYKDSVILNWSHEIDLALYLLGPARVDCASAGNRFSRAGTANSDINVLAYQEDIADIVLTHDSGARSTIHLDYVTRPEVRASMIVGSEGIINIYMIENRMATLYGVDGKTIVRCAKDNWDKNYKTEMQAFLDRIEGKQTLGATGEDGAATLGICLKARKAAGLK